MSANACPRCHKPLPESVLRDLARGTACPSCAAPLKRAPRRALDAPPGQDDGYESFQVSSTSVKVNATPPPSLKPGAVVAMKPAAVATMKPAAARTNLRATMVGTAVAARELPFNATPTPVSFSLSPPVTAPPARAPVPAPPFVALAPPPRAVAAPAPVPAAPPPPVSATPPPPPPPARLPLPGSVPAPASRGLGTVSPLVTASDSEPTHVALPPRGLGTVSPLVTASDSEPTRVAPNPREPASAEFQLGDGDSEAIASVTIRPDSAPIVAFPTLQPAPRRRSLAIVGVGMGLAIVALVVLGVKLVGGSKTTARDAPTEVAAPAPEPAPVVEAVAPPPAPKAPAPKAPAAQAAPKAAAPPAARPVVEKRSSSRHRTKAHHRRERRAQKVALQAPAAKRSAPPRPPERSDPRPPYERGNALLFAGDAKGAIVAYREAVKSSPSDPIGFRGLGLAYEQQGENAAAIRALHRYLKLAPAASDREIISRRIDRLAKRTKQK